jgi:hypothetical protein
MKASMIGGGHVLHRRATPAPFLEQNGQHAAYLIVRQAAGIAIALRETALAVIGHKPSAIAGAFHFFAISHGVCSIVSQASLGQSGDGLCREM